MTRNASERPQGERLRYLDGLRGLSILLVVCFHFLGPSEILPFKDRYAGFFLFREGWVGVEMFFLISGFVIFLTLQRCSTFLEFMGRRWRRLFPLMLVTTMLLPAFFIGGRIPMPAGELSWANLLPGLTFIHPSFYQVATGLPVQSIDGVFWTLYTEMAFYVLFGLLYFTLGWRSGVVALCALALVTRFVVPDPMAFGIPATAGRILEPLGWLRFELLGWFAAGVLFMKASQTGHRGTFMAACAIGLASALMYRSPVGTTRWDTLALVLVIMTFAGVQSSQLGKRLFESRMLVFFGFISYPLYLVHNRIGMAAIQIMGRTFPEISDFWWFVVAAGFVTLLAWVMARYVEPPLSRAFKRIPVLKLRTA